MATDKLLVPIDSAPIPPELVPTRVLGAIAKRLIIILRASGCAYDLRPEGGCTYCNFRALTSRGLPVSAADLLSQVTTALADYDCEREQISEIDIYNSGSFLNEAEVPIEAQIAIMKRCALEQNVRLVVVESRPEYINAARVNDLLRASARAQAFAQPFALEIGIGLESADDVIRERGLNKGFTRKAFERAVRIMGETGVGLLTYVMLKPLAMSDDEALDSVRQTAEYIHDVAARYGVRPRIALELTFVVQNTPLAKAYGDGRYQPPSLWLALEAVKKIAHLGDLRIGLWDEGLNPVAHPSSCPLCQDRILATLRQFNLTQDVTVLDIADCACREAFKFHNDFGILRR